MNSEAPSPMDSRRAFQEFRPAWALERLWMDTI